MTKEKITQLVPLYSPKVVTAYGIMVRKLWLRICDQLIVDMPQIEAL